MTFAPLSDAPSGDNDLLLTPELDDDAGDYVHPEEPAAEPVAVVSYTGGDAVTAFIAAPFHIAEFNSGIDGWGAITQAGTAGPGASIDQVIAAGVTSGVTIESR